MSRQHENTITTKLVDILNRMRSTWSLEEQTRPFKNNQKCPDVFVTELGREPVVIEVKLDGISPNTHGEAQAGRHLGNEADQDTVHYALDQRFLIEVLGITSADVHTAVGRLREKLCAEPSIHGGKKSRCDLEAERMKFGISESVCGAADVSKRVRFRT